MFRAFTISLHTHVRGPAAQTETKTGELVLMLVLDRGYMFLTSLFFISDLML